MFDCRCSKHCRFLAICRGLAPHIFAPYLQHYDDPKSWFAHYLRVCGRAHCICRMFDQRVMRTAFECDCTSWSCICVIFCLLFYMLLVPLRISQVILRQPDLLLLLFLFLFGASRHVWLKTSTLHSLATAFGPTPMTKQKVTHAAAHNGFVAPKLEPALQSRTVTCYKACMTPVLAPVILMKNRASYTLKIVKIFFSFFLSFCLSCCLSFFFFYFFVHVFLIILFFIFSFFYHFIFHFFIFFIIFIFLSFSFSFFSFF